MTGVAAAAASEAQQEASPTEEQQGELSQADAALVAAAGSGDAAEVRRLLADGADAAAQVSFRLPCPPSSAKRAVLMSEDRITGAGSWYKQITTRGKPATSLNHSI